MDEPRWLAIARRDLGTSETKGTRHTARVVDYFRAVGHAGIKDDETAWCAAFLGACLERAGQRSTRSLMARSYLAWGERLDRPRPGAVIVLSRGSNPALGHVGFYIRETASKIYLLGGNQGDKVSIAGYAKSRLIGIRWPKVLVVSVAADQAAAPTNAPPHSAPMTQAALAHVLEFEGGYSNDPQDPGGPTNLGITLATWAAYRGVTLTEKNRKSLIAGLKQIERATAAEIYAKRYWAPARCGDLPAAIAFMQFDCAVNQSVGRASRLLQQAVGADVDGEIGPLTLAAVAAADPAALLTSYASLREAHYRGLPHFPRFGRGWLRRLNAAHARARALIVIAPIVSGSAPARPDQPEPQPSPEPVAASADGVPMPTTTELEKGSDMTSEPITPEPTASAMPDLTEQKWWARSLTIWGAVISTLAAILPALGPVIGIELSATDVQAIGDDVVRLVQALGGALGLAMAIIGRLRASARLVRQPLTLRL